MQTPWSSVAFTRRLHGVLEISLRLQHEVSAVAMPCKHGACAARAVDVQWKHRESAENLHHEHRRNGIECHESSVATPWSL